GFLQMLPWDEQRCKQEVRQFSPSPSHLLLVTKQRLSKIRLITTTSHGYQLQSLTTLEADLENITKKKNAKYENL
ncbi:hypothetical protein OFM39_29220, partial [Escherichia coli]|nr:hypothetical protein [Escherichia coli]